MAEQTHIEWCDSTFNPWIGCTKVSPACDHCYAAVSTPARALGVAWGAGEARRLTSPANWQMPLRWNARAFAQCPSCGWRGEAQKCISVPHPDDQMPIRGCPECQAAGIRDARRRVFCASLADVFDNEVDPQWRADLFALIQATPNLDWLLLTKRIGNAHQMIGESLIRIAGGADLLPTWPWPNVWLGATICNQVEADRDIPKLLAAPAAVRFLSMEPLLGPVDIAWALGHRVGIGAGFLERGMFSPGLELLRRLDWVIAGGESGPAARPMHPDWVCSLRDQCAAARVPFLFKQWGEWAPAGMQAGGDLGGELRRGTVQHLHAPGNPEGFFRAGDAYVRRIGKKAAGRLLDGQEHDGVPGGSR